MDGAGNATAVWRLSDGVNVIIQTATRPLGGVWGGLVTLSSVALGADKPEVAVDAAGNATAVWLRDNGVNDILQAASRPAGGTWTTPVNLCAGAQFE